MKYLKTYDAITNIKHFDPDTVNHFLKQQSFDLIQAAKDNNFDMVKKLISTGVNLDQQDERGYTSLMITSYTNPPNNGKIAEELIKSGANLEIKDKNGYTALFFHIKNNNVYIVRKLIEAGSSVNDNDLLDLAAYNNYSSIVEELIKAGADLNRQDNNSGLTPLIFASANGNMASSKKLIDFGANLDIQDNFGDTALISCARNSKQPAYRKNIEIIRYLIKNGADWNLKNNKNKDFLNYLRPYDKKIIREEFPEKYKDYILKKDIEKYNL